MSDLPSLLPHNAGNVERDLEQVLARLQGLSLPIAVLWSPDLCPENLLPYLAGAMSIEIWDPTWTTEQKRATIRSSVAVHRVKGTRGAVERALAALGFRINLSEWFESGDPVHTFRLDAFGSDVFDAGFSIDAALYATVTRVIEAVKPVRSHFTLRIGETFENQVYLRNLSNASYVHRLDLTPAARTAESNTTAYLRSGHRMRGIDVHEHKPTSRIASGDAEIAARSGSRHRVTSRITHNFNVREGAAYAI